MKRLLINVIFLCISGVILGKPSGSIKEAKNVIQRFAGNYPVELSLSLDKNNGCDQFEIDVKNGRLEVKGSSGVALCRGFYHWVKSQNAGICSWSGNRFDAPEKTIQDMNLRVVSPFQDHYYFNVVTYGYTMPYWDWKRWEQEIDWMALHGIDMPLALVANEAIMARVWRKLGFTEQEIENSFVGPAHLPWMRMGNISEVDRPLPNAWHKDQIKLQHRILERMRALGMKPICPAFAGFVPETIKRIYPEVKLIRTSWDAFHSWMLPADEPLFQTIGKMFIEEWEKEFGKNKYYLADSFNEMSIPFPPHGTKERYEQVSEFGYKVYNSIRMANPEAVWVMQGWMFGHTKHIWDYKTLGALISKVPDDKMMILDLAVDYNYCWWKTEPNWEYYKGFMGKKWVFSVIPNMGGKVGMTGNMEFYANGGRLDALKSANKGNLTGYGMAPEGLENNEVLYELICDGGWTDERIDLNKWLDNYSSCRYGNLTDDIDVYWRNVLKSVYGTFTDHPRYNWQFRPGLVNKGSINASNEFYLAIENFAKAADDFKDSPLYLADLCELTAQYLGGKMEMLVQAIEFTYFLNKPERVAELEKLFTELALGADQVLSLHPTLRLDRWIDFARMHGKTDNLKNYYEMNARRLITIWGPPIDDYAARIWSGLIRDYYLPRWKHYFDMKRSGIDFDFKTWERDWVENKRGVSDVEPCNDPIDRCLELLKKASNITKETLQPYKEIGKWDASSVTTDWKEISWEISAEDLKELDGVVFQYVRGGYKLMINKVLIEVDGDTYVCDEHYGEAGSVHINNLYRFDSLKKHKVTDKSKCLLKAIVKSDGKHQSFGNVIEINDLED